MFLSSFIHRSCALSVCLSTALPLSSETWTHFPSSSSPSKLICSGWLCLYDSKHFAKCSLFTARVLFCLLLHCRFVQRPWSPERHLQIKCIQFTSLSQQAAALRAFTDSQLIFTVALVAHEHVFLSTMLIQLWWRDKFSPCKAGSECQALYDPNWWNATAL